jgi:serine phosphatase RsbU (regulator of sigma subunit)
MNGTIMESNTLRAAFSIWMRTRGVIKTIWISCLAAAIAALWVWGAFYVQRFLSEPVHPGTVVSVLFLIVLFSANYWGLIPAFAASMTAALFFMTYFQPPIGRVATTPQGWISTGSFFLASMLVSRLSIKARRSAAEALRRSRESDLIEQFGRGLLACSSSQLVASTAVNQAVSLFGASAAAFEFVLEGGTHRSGPGGWEWSVPELLRHQALARGDWVRDPSHPIVVIPLVLEHTPIAYFGIRDAELSDTLLTAISRQLVMTLGRVLAGEKLLHLAGQIQMGLLPKKFPAFPSASDVDVFATIVPALEVGGDFYHYFLLDSDHLCFVIGDVSDKGIPAALFMAMTLTAFVVFAKDGGRTLPESIQLLNRYLCDNNPLQMFVTLYAGVVDLRTGVVEYSDAGHEPPFVIRVGGKPELIEKQGGMALGVDPSVPYQSATVRLNPGDTLFLYTDGVNEAKNGDGKLFKMAGIEAALASNVTTSCEVLCDVVMKRLGQFVHGAPQSDDITMLAVSYRGHAKSKYLESAKAA